MSFAGISGISRSARVEVQIDKCVRIVVRPTEQPADDGHVQTGFLPALADCTFRRVFSPKALSAWELGKARQLSFVAADPDQKAAAVLDDRDSNANPFFRHRCCQQAAVSWA